MVHTQGGAADLPSMIYLAADTTPTSFDPVLSVGINETFNSPVSRNAEMLEWTSAYTPAPLT